MLVLYDVVVVCTLLSDFVFIFFFVDVVLREEEEEGCKKGLCVPVSVVKIFFVDAVLEAVVNGVFVVGFLLLFSECHLLVLRSGGAFIVARQFSSSVISAISSRRGSVLELLVR